MLLHQGADLSLFRDSEWMNKHFALLHYRSQVNCEAFGHVVMKFGGELYRFPADSEPAFFFFFFRTEPTATLGGT